MKKEIELDSYLNLRLTKELRKQYKEYCDNNGLALSKRLRFLISKDIEGKLIIK